MTTQKCCSPTLSHQQSVWIYTSGLVFVESKAITTFCVTCLLFLVLPSISIRLLILNCRAPKTLRGSIFSSFPSFVFSSSFSWMKYNCKDMWNKQEIWLLSGGNLCCYLLTEPLLGKQLLQLEELWIWEENNYSEKCKALRIFAKKLELFNLKFRYQGLVR